MGRAPFSDESDIVAFAAARQAYTRGEMAEESWRALCSNRGVLVQPQADSYIFRFRIPQGILTARALRAIAECCERHGHGVGHAAARQDVQLHFVTLEGALDCMGRLAEVGLPTADAGGNCVHNIIACPRAGLCPGEAFDVTPYAEAMTRHFLRHPLGSSVPRKVKTAFGGCAGGCASEDLHDMGFTARLRDGRPGFRVVVGGGLGVQWRMGWLLADFLPAEHLLSAAEAVIRLFHRLGNRANKNRARLKYSILHRGWERWKALFDAEFAAILAEGGIPLPFDPAAPPQDVPPGPGSPPQGADSAAFRAFRATNIRPQRQEGWVTVTACPDTAALTPAQFRLLAEVAETFADGTVRMTPDQGVMLRWVRPEAAAALFERLEAAGLGRAGAHTIAAVTTCPGPDTCRFAFTQARGLGREITRFLDTRPDLTAAAPDATIKVSGCPFGCSRHPVATIGLQGRLRRLKDGSTIPQYQILLGGSPEHFGRRSIAVPARRVTEALARLLEWYRAAAAPGEAAADFFARCDLGEAEHVLAGLRTRRPEDHADFAGEFAALLG